MKVIVCGGRHYANYGRVLSILDAMAPTCIVHGAARGADTLAQEWATSRGVHYRGYPAKWHVNGQLDRGAGHKRNRFMYQAERSDLEAVVAFPGGNGTEGMCSVAEAGGTLVLRVPPTGDPETLVRNFMALVTGAFV